MSFPFFSVFAATCVYILVFISALLFLFFSFLVVLRIVDAVLWYLLLLQTTSLSSQSLVFDWVRPQCRGGLERVMILAKWAVREEEYERFELAWRIWCVARFTVHILVKNPRGTQATWSGWRVLTNRLWRLYPVVPLPLKISIVVPFASPHALNILRDLGGSSRACRFCNSRLGSK